MRAEIKHHIRSALNKLPGAEMILLLCIQYLARHSMELLLTIYLPIATSLVGIGKLHSV